MKLIKRTYLFAAFVTAILFSQASSAIIITSYTAFYEDGSTLVVNLKNYDYGEGSYFASSSAWNEPPFPPVEDFDTVFHPSLSLQQQFGFQSGAIGSSFSDSGLLFKVDESYGVSMINFNYMFQLPDWSIGNGGIHVQHYDFPYHYHLSFSGGFFKTYTSPYQVDESGNLALMMIGISGLIWARRRRNAQGSISQPLSFAR